MEKNVVMTIPSSDVVNFINFLKNVDINPSSKKVALEIYKDSITIRNKYEHSKCMISTYNFTENILDDSFGGDYIVVAFANYTKFIKTVEMFKKEDFIMKIFYGEKTWTRIASTGNTNYTNFVAFKTLIPRKKVKILFNNLVELGLDDLGYIPKNLIMNRLDESFSVVSFQLSDSDLNEIITSSDINYMDKICLELKDGKLVLYNNNFSYNIEEYHAKVDSFMQYFDIDTLGWNIHKESNTSFYFTDKQYLFNKNEVTEDYVFVGYAKQDNELMESFSSSESRTILLS